MGLFCASFDFSMYLKKEKGMGGLSLKREPLKNKTKLLSSHQLILFKERRI